MNWKIFQKQIGSWNIFKLNSIKGRNSMQWHWHLGGPSILQNAGNARIQVGQYTRHIYNFWQNKTRSFTIYPRKLDTCSLDGPKVHVHEIFSRLSARHFLANNRIEHVLLETHLYVLLTALARKIWTFISFASLWDKRKLEEINMNVQILLHKTVSNY